MRRGRHAARLLLAAATLVVFGAGCGHASTSAVGTTTASTAAATTRAASTSAAAAPATAVPAAGGNARAFCALARAKGAADLLNLRDNSAQGGGLDKILANLDELTAAAPAAIKGDYVRLDQLEHALLGGQPDPQQLARVESTRTAHTGALAIGPWDSVTNADVADLVLRCLLGRPLERFDPGPYLTCLDLGGAGAVATAGWDREVRLTGEAAKALKKAICESFIYPPVNDADALLAAAAHRPHPAVLT